MFAVHKHKEFSQRVKNLYEATLTQNKMRNKKKKKMRIKEMKKKRKKQPKKKREEARKKRVEMGTIIRQASIDE